MDTPIFGQGAVILLFAAASYTIAHGGRLLMQRRAWPVWLAGTLFGFLAFLVSRLALAGASWVVFEVLFARAPSPWVLAGLVGIASAPLLLSFVNLTPFYGPGAMRVLYFLSLIWLTSVTSSELNMDWLGCLGWWVAAWLLLAGASFCLTRPLRNARWLGWTGILGRFRTTPQEVMAEMPGMKDARWA
jgi:hypothetical protein